MRKLLITAALTASALAAAVCGAGSASASAPPALCVGTSCYYWQPPSSYYTLKIPFTVDGQAGQDVLQVLQVTTATKETYNPLAARLDERQLRAVGSAGDAGRHYGRP